VAASVTMDCSAQITFPSRLCRVPQLLVSWASGARHTRRAMLQEGVSRVPFGRSSLRPSVALLLVRRDSLLRRAVDVGEAQASEGVHRLVDQVRGPW
jgi:hypothetical protein